MNTMIGIDLGTTNSEVAVVQNGQVLVLKIEGSKIVPSVVSLDAEGEILVGKAAVNNELASPENTIRWVKRQMGEEELLSLGNQTYTPSMISSFILKKLKLAAEDFLQHPVEKAVITVPAFFNEKQREATKEAALLAGLEPVRLLNEPTAAALAYSLNKKERELCLVYDLGGGTFDVSIVQLSPEVMEVKASHGDTELGGSDIDHLIAGRIRQEFLEVHGVDLSKDSLAWIRVMRAAETAKMRLSTEPSVQIVEEFITTKEGIPLHLRYNLLRTDLEEMVLPLLERTLSSVRKTLEMAEITPEQIDRVILVGGVTHMPLVSQLLEKELQVVPQAWVDPSTVVARGAAIEATSLAGQPLGPTMVDITPHSLGTECLDEYYYPFNEILIRRNTPIPCTASKVFYKMHSHQNLVKINVYQGESREVAQNQLLGQFTLDELSESPGLAILVKYHLDRSGLLHVTASDVATGKQIQRALKKMKRARQQDVELAHLESVRIYHKPALQTEASSDSEEDWDELSEVEESSSSVGLDSEQLFAKVQALLEKQTLETTDQEDLNQAFERAKTGDPEAVEKLSSLVYYLE